MTDRLFLRIVALVFLFWVMGFTAGVLLLEMAGVVK